MLIFFLVFGPSLKIGACLKSILNLQSVTIRKNISKLEVTKKIRKRKDMSKPTLLIKTKFYF